MNIFKALCLLSFVSSFALADNLTTMQDLVRSSEQQTRRYFGNEVVEKLRQYRISIEDEAYQTTLELCPIYKNIIGFETPDDHFQNIYAASENNLSPTFQKWSENSYHQDQYDEITTSSLLAWMKVAYEGGSQPFSAIFGMKADYLEQTNTSLLTLRSWFGSLYILFLVNSHGFLEGAMHCLGTMDQEAIHRFASTLLIFDGEMSLAGHALTFAAGGVVIGAIIKSVKFAARPLSKGFSLFKQKIYQKTGVSLELSPKTKAFLPSKKTTLILGGAILATGGGIYISHLIDQRKKINEAFQKKIFKDIKKEDHHKP